MDSRTVAAETTSTSSESNSKAVPVWGLQAFQLRNERNRQHQSSLLQ